MRTNYPKVHGEELGLQQTKGLARKSLESNETEEEGLPYSNTQCEGDAEEVCDFGSMLQSVGRERFLRGEASREDEAGCDQTHQRDRSSPNGHGLFDCCRGSILVKCVVDVSSTRQYKSFKCK